MVGSFRWNAGMGIAGMLLVFAVSVGNNGFAVSCLRGLYAFLAFFLLAYAVRAVLHVIVSSAGSEPAATVPNPDVGGQVDLATPETGEDLNELLKGQLDAGRTAEASAEFKPFKPTRLVSTQNKDPEEIAQAIRHLAEQNERS